MAGKFALIIGNSRYEDSSLSRLSAPDLDVQGLEGVLKDPDVGSFDEVTTLLNEGCASVRRAVARFYDRRQRDDLLLLYFSGHGVKDEQGHLYLALRDTESKLLAGTAIETAFIAGRMDRSFSKRQVLVLDCCHSGAFAHGAKAAQGVSVGTAEAFEGTGLGRVILTATDSTQYAWDGDQVIGDAHNSLFTHFLIEGLKTGAADRDEDGAVTVDELYDYVHEQVVNTTPRQTPNKWTYRQEGEIVLAQNPFAKRSTLPPEIEEAISSSLLSLRLGAVRDLEILLRGHHAGRSRAALAALKGLSLDDSRKVANAAVEALKDCDENERRQRIQPHLTAARAAIEAKQFVQALESLRRVSKLDAHAEGLAELVRIAEEGQADVQSKLAERMSRQPNRPDAVAPAMRNAESRPNVDDRSGSHSSDIFISYAHEDREKARALANVLAARGWKVWWDRKIAPGEAFDVVIERELGTCKCAIVLWSAHSVGATWVRNEARRAARRKVLVPILIESVETPLEFENLQAADLTSWEAPAEHPEFEAVFDKIQALSPIPDERLARSAVEQARGEFGAGRRQAAVASLEAFRPAHVLVSRALTELRGEAERIDQERAATVRREAEAAQRERALAAAAQGQQALGAAKVRIESLLEHRELDAAERALAIADREFERPAEFRPLRERLEVLRGQAQHEQQARTAVEDARRQFDEGHHQAALLRLEQFRPAHDLVTRSLNELRAEAERIERERAEAERIERERAEATRREAVAAQRQRELSTATALIEDFLERRELDAAERALSTAERTFEHPGELRRVRERLYALRDEARREQLALNAVVEARREFGAGRREAALAGLETFRPAHGLVSGALTELRAEADRIERERADAARREAESAQRQREPAIEQNHIDRLLTRGEPDAVEQTRTTVEETLEHSPALHSLSARYDGDQRQAPLDASTSVEPHLRTFSWSRSGLALAAVAGLLALIAGTWLAGLRPGRTAGGSQAPSQGQSQPSERATPVPGSPTPNTRRPSVENASASSSTESASPAPSPIERVPPAPEPSPAITVVPNRSGESAVGKPSSPSGLEALRTQALKQEQAGQREQALNTVVQGLQIDRKDPGLRNMLDTLLRDARMSAAQAKQEALDLDALDLAGKTFRQGLVKEKAAENERRSSRLDAATRSFLMAERHFVAAAEESRRIAEKEPAAGQALTKGREIEPVANPVPRTPIQPEPPPLNGVLETEAVTQTIRRYEEAFASLNADAVRKVYPSTPDDLERDFAAARSYTVKVEVDGGFRFGSSGSQSFGYLASATGRVIQDVVPKSGDKRHSERPVTILLAKPGNTWIITGIR